MNYIKIIIGAFLFYFEKAIVSLKSSYLNSKYKRRFKSFGKNVVISGICKITGSNMIEVGDNVHIGPNAYIRGEGGLYIGDNAHIAMNLTIYTHNHNYEGELLPYDNTRKYRKVIIEKNVWIGINVTILPGTHIEEGAIIGAGSVVAGKIPKLSIYGAATASKIKERNSEHYYLLESQKKYGGIDGSPMNN